MRNKAVTLSTFLFLCIGSAALGAADENAPDSSSKPNPKAAKGAIPPDQVEFFESKIRPVFSQNCERCHGSKKQESGLRLDSRAAFDKGSDAGPVVEPGRPEESPLVEAVNHSGPVKMPPDSKLSPAAIADIAAWIRMGAPWPESPSSAGARGGALDQAAAIGKAARGHWAFRPIRAPEPPPVRDSSAVRTPVDRFIAAKLEAKGLTPAPRADRRTLVRRAYFDLVGLPPSPEEVAAFETDESPDAFTRLVDRLLADPRYGERWGRHWLDVARYADTKGYVLFENGDYPWAFTYRDYVVRSFNADLPYDRFIVEQLAADKLLEEKEKEKEREKTDPSAARRSLPALGFITVGGQFMNNPHDVRDDRIDVVTRGLLGLTVTCARCHDHKFDPIPTKDYYALYGVFASSVEPVVPPEFQRPPQTEAYARYVQELAKREQAIKSYVAAKRAELVESSKTRAAEYLITAQKSLDQPTAEEFMLLADGDDLNPVMVVRWQSFLNRTRKEKNAVFAPWHALAAVPPEEFAAQAPAVLARLQGTAASAVVLHALTEAKPATLADVAAVYSRLLNAADKMGAEAALRSKLENGPARTLADADWEAVRRIFDRPDSPPHIPVPPFGDLSLVPDRASQAELQKLRNEFDSWLNTGPGAPPRAMTLEDVPIPYEPRVFLRGNPHNLGEPVARRFLTVLSRRGDSAAADSPGARGDSNSNSNSNAEPEPFHNGSGRLELARAIADPANPLTARVLVNRVWMHHMGSPLVATPSDFGVRSDPPSHPALLDDLAASFIASGWSIKTLHRRIMLSSAYQRQSADRPEARAADPENTLYWRANRRRLDFESLRDALLTVSGRLDPVMGGPAKPSATDPAMPERSVYMKIDRLSLPGLFRTFDFPDPSASSPKRDQSTVAPQALFLMNHPFVIAAAQALAGRAEADAGADLDRKFDRMIHLAYGRGSTVEERDLAREFLKGPAAGSAAKAAWTELAQALLMSNEFAFID